MTGQWSGHGRTSQNISTGTLAYRFPLRKWWVGKNEGLASLGSTWHLTHHFLMQWSPHVQAGKMAFKFSSTEFLQTLCFIPRDQWPLGASCQLSQELVIFHRITPRISLDPVSSTSYIFFSAWCFTYSEMKQHGQLNLCHRYFSSWDR